MKKILFCLFTALLSCSAWAEIVEINGINYSLNVETKEASVWQTPAPVFSGDIVIPSSVDYSGVTYSVTSIGDYAFRSCSGLTSITIPESVTSIGNYAFLLCSGLTSITIPNSVTSIGDYAFHNCSGLTSMIVELGNTKYDSRNNCNAIIETASNALIAGCKATVIPNSVTSIGNYAFYGCSGLTSVIIPNSVKSIGDWAFQDCSDLTSVTIPNSVTSIGYRAFEGCTGLTSITIPNSVTSIGGYAFSGCSGLTSVTLNSNAIVSKQYSAYINLKSIFGDQVTEYIIGDDVTSIGGYAFRRCSFLTSITIPESVTSIDNYAFEGCSGLTSVDIPNSVTSIGEEAFSSCYGLTSITIGNSVTSIGSSAFSNCDGLTSVTVLNSTPVAITEYVFTNRWYETLYVPKGSKGAYQTADYWNEFEEIIEIDVTGIDDVKIAEESTPVAYFDMNGREIPTPQKGMNIVKYKNGKTEKVFVR